MLLQGFMKSKCFSHKAYWLSIAQPYNGAVYQAKGGHVDDLECYLPTSNGALLPIIEE
jgi:hypothetical protein